MTKRPRFYRSANFRWLIMMAFSLGAIFYYNSNQQIVPFTERTQLRFMTGTQEMILGQQVFERILADEDTYRLEDGLLVDTIKDIGRRLAWAAAPEDPGFTWFFEVMDLDKVDAFVLAGGYSAVYTGLMPLVQNEDGLAVVLAHAIGHALAHHGSERMADENLLRIVGAGVSFKAADVEYDQRYAVMNIFAGLVHEGRHIPFSLQHESEADYIGLMLAARACFDPRAAPILWQRLESMGHLEPIEFALTHPMSTQRRDNFKRWIPAAIALYNQNCTRQIDDL